MIEVGSEITAEFSTAHRKEVRPNAKFDVIHRHRNEYSIPTLCKIFGVSRSGYYAFVKQLGQLERDTDLAKRIEECRKRTYKTYGYRRTWKWIKDREIVKNPKTVLRVMKKYGLLSENRRHRKGEHLGQ